MIKGSSHKKYITILHASDLREHKYMTPALTDIKLKIVNNTIIKGYFNTLLLIMNRTSIQNNNNETEDLNNTIDQVDLIETYRIFHSAVAEHTFFSSNMEHSLGSHARPQNMS